MTASYVTTEWLMSPDKPDPWEWLEQITQRPAWQARAACRGSGTAAFFPERGGDSVTALAICEGCRVVNECRNYAVADPDVAGVWGGTSGRQRRKMRQVSNGRS